MSLPREIQERIDSLRGAAFESGRNMQSNALTLEVAHAEALLWDALMSEAPEVLKRNLLTPEKVSASLDAAKNAPRGRFTPWTDVRDALRVTDLFRDGGQGA